MKILLTSGGTRVPIDRVRHIANMSHGTFGSKIARELLLARKDIKLIFLHAERSLTPFTLSLQLDKVSEEEAVRTIRERVNFAYSEASIRYRGVTYKTYEDYAARLEDLLVVEKPDVVVLAAAVSDYLVANYVDGKIRSSDAHHIELKDADKIINRVKQWHPGCRLIGFKLKVDSTDDELIAAAKESVVKNGCEFVVANDLRDIMNNNHRLTLVWQDTVEQFHTDPNDDNYLARIVAKTILKK